MTGVNRTLYIPLYGKAYVSGKGLFLEDRKAEEIWAAEGFVLKGKSKSKWLAYYMGIRSAVFDGWLREQMADMEDAAIIHIGCGLDSRVLRVGTMGHKWYDLDFEEVIAERKRHYSETEDYRMLSGNAVKADWLSEIAEENAIVVMEGVSMYMKEDELKALMEKLSGRFEKLSLLMDCYSVFAASVSKHKNPINDVGVTEVYGMDRPETPENGRLTFVKEHEMTPQKLMDELSGMEKRIFEKLYAGSFAKKLYRLYEYRAG